jgi:hypothetical protein
MKTADWTLSIVILVVFFLLFFSTILMTGVSTINENWATYRCNPMVMPFASIFGHDPIKNFNHCAGSVQSIQITNIMKPLTQEVNSTAAESKQTRANSRRLAHKQQGLISALTAVGNSLNNISTNLSVEANRSSLAVTNVFRTMAGILQLVSESVRGITLTAKSIKNVVERVPGFK